MAASPTARFTVFSLPVNTPVERIAVPGVGRLRNLIIQGAQRAHVARRGVAANPVIAQPQLVALYQRTADLRHGNVLTPQKLHERPHGRAIVAGTAGAALLPRSVYQPVGMPAKEIFRRPAFCGLLTWNLSRRLAGFLYNDFLVRVIFLAFAE
jgi:hypothetical protein